MVVENRKGLSIVVLLNVLINFGSIDEINGASIRNNFKENETIDEPETQTRVYKGVEAHARAEPFIVYIVKQEPKPYSNYYGACAGSILSKEHILTAAHCLDDDFEAIDEGRLFVWAEPEDNITQVKGFPVKHPSIGQYIRVKKALLHKDYNSPAEGDNDIAVYTLAKPLELKRGRVESICIYDGSWENRPVVLGGWGLFDCKHAYVFHNATGTTIANKDCAAAYKKRDHLNRFYSVNITSRQICARLKGINNQLAEHAAGDSGGPLFTIQNGYPQQIGVVNFKITKEVDVLECPNTDYPGVYARTSEYISFIQSTGVSNNFVCKK